MRQHIGRLLGLALAVACLSGCDDDSASPAPADTKHSTAPRAERVGGGWHATADSRVSAWDFASDPDQIEGIADALAINRLPQRETVRAAALISRFAAGLPAPEPGEGLKPTIVLTTTPWNDDTLLLLIGVSAGDPPQLMMPRDLVGGHDRPAIRVEFNPKEVSAYRPIGDPSTLPATGGGTASAVTLYELTLPRDVEPQAQDQYGTLRIRFRPSAGGEVQEIVRPITYGDYVENLDDTPAIVRFVAAVGGFGALLRGDPGVGDLSCEDVLTLARSAAAPDPDGARAKLIRLMEEAEPLIDQPPLDATATEDASH